MTEPGKPTWETEEVALWGAQCSFIHAINEAATEAAIDLRKSALPQWRRAVAALARCEPAAREFGSEVGESDWDRLVFSLIGSQIPHAPEECARLSEAVDEWLDRRNVRVPFMRKSAFLSLRRWIEQGHTLSKRGRAALCTDLSPITSFGGDDGAPQPDYPPKWSVVREPIEVWEQRLVAHVQKVKGWARLQGFTPQKALHPWPHFLWLARRQCMNESGERIGKWWAEREGLGLAGKIKPTPRRTIDEAIGRMRRALSLPEHRLRRGRPKGKYGGIR